MCDHALSLIFCDVSLIVYADDIASLYSTPIVVSSSNEVY